MSGFQKRRREYVARKNDEHIRQRKAKWYSSNRERLRKKSAEYYIANRGLWEKWAEDNRDYRKEYQKQYWAETRDTQLPRLAEYRASNPHLWWEYAYLQRAEKYGFAPDMKSLTKDSTHSPLGDACWHCKGPFEELDHAIVPVAHGGEHSLENCRPSCTRCNRSHSIRTISRTDIGETA